MFQSARIKLTAWYFVVISVTSLAFSLIIYRAVTLELEHGFVVAETRLRSQSMPRKLALAYLSQELIKSKKTVLKRLLVIDSVITITATAVGYFLAGKTLRPIEQANEDQKRFIGDASHELKTPLTAIQTATEVALMDKKMKIDEARKVLHDNLEEIARMRNLTNNLLALSHQQQNNVLVKETLDVYQVLQDAVDKFRPMAKKKHITIKTHLVHAQIKTDKTSFERLISILLDNSIKFTKDLGKVKVSNKITSKWLTVKVSDTGVGIANKDLPHIFNRFYQANKSRSKGVAEGFGLGLSIAKNIVKSLHGNIHVESKINKGSTFTIKLPKSF